MLLHPKLVATSLAILGCVGCPGRRTPDAAADTGVDARADVVTLSDIGIEIRDAGVADASGDVVGYPFDGSRPDGECYQLPAPTTDPPTTTRGWTTDAGCGDGCTQVTWFQPGLEGNWMSDRLGVVEFAADIGIFDYTPSTNAHLTNWLAPTSSGPPVGLCSGNGSSPGPGSIGLTSYAVNGETATIGCYNYPHRIVEFHTVDLATRRDCVDWRTGFPSSGTLPGNIFKVRGATVWLQTFSDGPNDVWILDDNSSSPRQLTNCHCVNYLTASDDYIAFLSEARTGDSGDSLWVARPPFTSAQPVWSIPRRLALITHDPDQPHHLVFQAGDGDPVCPTNIDIYFADLDTLDTTPPRAVSDIHDGISQLVPLIRGDLIAFLDYAGDPSNAAACPSAGHSVNNIALTSLSHGGRQQVLTSSAAISPLWITADRVYLRHYLAGTAYVMLPP